MTIATREVVNLNTNRSLLAIVGTTLFYWVEKGVAGALGTGSDLRLTPKPPHRQRRPDL